MRALAGLGASHKCAAKAANFLLNCYERRAGRVKLRSLPLGADIVSTRRCNLNCIMCIKYKSKPPHDVSIADFERIAEDLFDTLLYVRFCSGGEHLLRKDFREILTRCSRASCLVSIVTNGMLLNRSWADFLVARSSVWQITVSFDGARKETLESIRRNVSYELVLENVRGLVEARRACWKRLPTVSFRFTALKKNVAELPAFVELAAQVGVDTVHVGYMTTPRHVDQRESLWHHADLARDSFAEAQTRAERLGVDLRLPGLIGGTPRAAKDVGICPLPWTQMYIDPNGDVRLCCNAWDEAGVMGNLHEEPLASIWNGERLREVRRSLLAGEPIYPRCRNCPALCLDPTRREMHFVGE